MIPVFDEQMMLRDGCVDDHAFIYATWLRGLYYGNTWFKQIPQKIYFETYHKAIEAVLSRPQTKVLVACFKDEPSVLTGYSISRGETLHWVFVKTAWRKIGIAKKLVPKEITQVTHLTTQGQKLKPKEWIFNPFAL